MSWVAKNDITGKVYGKPFESVYDCQDFIDKELYIHQYEWKRIALLDEEWDCEQEFRKWQQKYGSKNGNIIATEIMDRFRFNLLVFSGNRHRSQNVIRCYNTTQKRWADGFDF